MTFIVGIIEGLQKATSRNPVTRIPLFSGLITSLLATCKIHWWVDLEETQEHYCVLAFVRYHTYRGYQGGRVPQMAITRLCPSCPRKEVLDLIGASRCVDEVNESALVLCVN